MPQLDIIIGFNIYIFVFLIIFLFFFFFNFFFLSFYLLYMLVVSLKNLWFEKLIFCYNYISTFDIYFFFFWNNIWYLNLFFKKYFLKNIFTSFINKINILFYFF